VDVEEGKCPQVTLRVSLQLLGAESPDKDKDGRKLKSRGLHRRYNLLALFIRSDGLMIDFRKTP
jgi:hypothetical protein